MARCSTTRRWWRVNAVNCNGACHGPDPLDRQNRIQLGENAGNIANAINNLVVQMAFLRGTLQRRN